MISREKTAPAEEEVKEFDTYTTARGSSVVLTEANASKISSEKPTHKTHQTEGKWSDKNM